MWALEVEGICKNFGLHVAVHDVSLWLAKGGFLSLLGPSGCGKTTTLRMIGGFTPPNGGRVLIHGRDVTAIPPYQRNVGFVFQNYALFPHMTVFANVAFGLRMRRVSKAVIKDRVRRILNLVQLEGLAERYPSQLSGGQQQRVALARALVIEPEILLLDEPLSNLDAKLRASMRIEIKALQRSLGISTVYVTHDQVEAQVMSDSVAVMNQGRVIQTGSARDLYDRPRNRFVAEFMGEANMFAGRVAGRGGDAIEVCVEGGDRLRALGPTGGIPDEVYVCVRPERVRINRKPVGLSNCVKGVLGDIIFMGSVTRYQVRFAGGVVKSDWAAERRSDFGPGELVFLEWEVDDSIVVAEH